MSIIPVLATGKAKGKKIVPIPLDEQIYNWLKTNWGKKWEDIEPKLEYQIDVWVNHRKMGKRVSSEVPRPPTPPTPPLSRESPIVRSESVIILDDPSPEERVPEKPVEKSSPPIVEKPVEKSSPPIVEKVSLEVISPPVEKPIEKITPEVVSPPMIISPPTHPDPIWNTYLPPPPTLV
jgi:hypothetical protein